MIVRLQGNLEFVGDDCVHLTVGELTYELLVPAADIQFLQTQVGQRVTFFTLDYIEGNPSFGSLTPRLIGFLRAIDKDFFDLFTTVKGIGVRKALRALSIPTTQIASAIALKDVKTLKTLDGVGARAAEQIIAELHGKVEKFAIGATPAVPLEQLPDYQQTAIAALVQLGERRAEAESWVARACKADGTLKDPQSILRAVYRLKQGF